MKRWIFVGVAWLLGGHAWAHDFWLMPQAGMLELHRGHRHSDHGGAKDVPFGREAIVGAWCRRDGLVKSVSPLNDAYPFRFDSDCDVLTVVVDSGIWTQTLTGIEHKSADEVSIPIKSWRAVESVTYVRAGMNMPQPVAPKGMSLVFRKAPHDLSVGDKVRLKALLHGAPASGALVAYEGRTRGETDEAGRINLRIRHEGVQTISASYKDYRDPAPGTRYTLHAATLHFTVNDR